MQGGAYRRGAVAKFCERGLGFVDELLRNLPGAIQTKQLGVGGLVSVEVLASSLAEVLRARSHVQNVVSHLRRAVAVASAGAFT